jgi:hypothetical protein
MLAWTLKGTVCLLVDFQFHLASRECGMIMLWILAGQENQQNSYSQQVLSLITMSGNVVKVLLKVKSFLPRVLQSYHTTDFLVSLLALKLQ